MRPNLQPWFYLWFCLLPASPLVAQEIRPDAIPVHLAGSEVTFTRAQAVQFALAHSPLLGAAQERIAAAQGNLQSAKAIPPAEVSIGPSFGADVGTVPLISQTIEISGKRGARTGVAQGELTGTQRESDTTRLDVIREVSRAYYDLAQAYQARKLFLEVTSIVRRTRDSVKLQVDKGQLPAQDLIKAETELARAEADVSRVQADVAIRSIALNTAMGRQGEAPLNASEPVAFTPVTFAQTALLSQAAQQRPELATAEARIRAARENVRLQQADLRPDLSVSLLENTSVGSRDFFSSRGAGIGVSLVFPFGDTGRIRGKTRQAEALVREQERLRDQTRLIVQRDVGAAYAQVKLTETLVRRYEEDILPNTQDLLSKAQFGYERGGTTLLEYLEAQRTYRNTRAEYLGILGDNARARADLERAVGAPVK